MAALGNEIVAGQVHPINRTPSRLSIPAAFATPRFETAFGLPALAWSQEDVAAAIKLSGDCATQAKRARNAPEIASLTAVWRGFGGLRATLGAIAATEPKIDTGLKLLLEDAPSRATLDALRVVASMRDGGDGALAATENDLKDSSVRLKAWGNVHSHAQFLVRTLSDAPTASWQRVFAPVDARIVTVRQWVIDDANAQINALPDTLQGLAQLDPLQQKTRTELAAAFSESELATLDGAAAAKREIIEDTLLAAEAARVDAAPVTAEGLNQLRAVQESQVMKVLSPARVSTLDGKIIAQRETIGATVTDQQIKQLDQFPETMVGLRDLDAFKTGTANGLAALVSPQAAGKFSDAAARRASAIGEAALGPFRAALDDMPATEEGLKELDGALNEITASIAALDPPVRDRYLEAATKRREKIIAAVQKEDARLARMPLKGGAVFVDREIDAKLEFRDKKRVYLTIFRETTEAEYEVDGDRVIIRLPRGNQVFTRDGPWIRGSELNFKRQAGN